jgi:hypothetical protein
MIKSATSPHDLHADAQSELSLPTPVHDVSPSVSERKNSVVATFETLRERARSSTGGDGSCFTGHTAASVASFPSLQHDGDQNDLDKGEKWCKAGLSMNDDNLSPGWSSLRHNTWMEHGEAMVREQEYLQHKKKLYQQMSLEGTKSPMRRHLAQKIHSRLREEKAHDPQVAMEVHQTCVSIRKNLTGLSNARKNLNTLKVEAQTIIQPEQSQKRLGLSLDIFHKSQFKNFGGLSEGDDNFFDADSNKD